MRLVYVYNIHSTREKQVLQRELFGRSCARERLERPASGGGGIYSLINERGPKLAFIHVVRRLQALVLSLPAAVISLNCEPASRAFSELIPGKLYCRATIRAPARNIVVVVELITRQLVVVARVSLGKQDCTE